MAALAAATAAAPADFETRKARARALLEEMNFGEALKVAQAVHREWPDDVATYQLMAAAHLGLGNYADAEEQLQWMLDLRIGKADAQGWLLVARFREATGDIEGASDAVNLAHSHLTAGQEREASALLAYAAHLQYLAGRLDLAERVAEQALSGGRAEPLALETLARVRVAQQKHSSAIEILRRLAKASGHARHLYLLAEATRAPADYAAFERAALEVSASPNNANRELALYYAGPGKRPAEAVGVARRELERRHDTLTLDALAVALLAGGQTADARTTMKRALESGTRDPEVLEHAARLGLKSGAGH